MKIDNSIQDIRNHALDRVGRPDTPVGKPATAPLVPAAEGRDEVRLSDDAQLMQAALQAVKDTPDVRQDVVDRMRAALANGEIGNDSVALADTLIDRLLGDSSERR